MTERKDAPPPDEAAPTEGEYLQDTPLVPLPGVEPDEPLERKDADRPEAKPHGTLKDQLSAMEGEGQAQPQAGDIAPD